MTSNLKRILNEVDDIDYSAAEQYARRPAPQTASPATQSSSPHWPPPAGPDAVEASDRSASSATTSPLRQGYDTAGGSRRSSARGGTPYSGSLHDSLGGFLHHDSAHSQGRGRTGSGFGSRDSEADLERMEGDLMDIEEEGGRDRLTLAPMQAGPAAYGAYDSGTLDAGYASDKVCYGMLHNVDVKIGSHNIKAIDSRLKSQPQSSQQRFVLFEQPDHVMLYFRDAPELSPTSPSSSSSSSRPAEFGYLRSNMKRDLGGLLTRQDLVFEASMSSRSLRQIVSGFKKSSDALARVDILVYGPREAGHEVGRSLSRRRLYLQRPGWPIAASYENPHELTFDGMEGVEEEVPPEVHRVDEGRRGRRGEASDGFEPPGRGRQGGRDKGKEKGRGRRGHLFS